jgi:hypothetical protein
VYINTLNEGLMVMICYSVTVDYTFAFEDILTGLVLKVEIEERFEVKLYVRK